MLVERSELDELTDTLLSVWDTLLLLVSPFFSSSGVVFTSSLTLVFPLLVTLTLPLVLDLVVLLLEVWGVEVELLVEGEAAFLATLGLEKTFLAPAIPPVLATCLLTTDLGPGVWSEDVGFRVLEEDDLADSDLVEEFESVRVALRFVTVVSLVVAGAVLMLVLLLVSFNVGRETGTLGVVLLGLGGGAFRETPPAPPSKSLILSEIGVLPTTPDNLPVMLVLFCSSPDGSSTFNFHQTNS